MPTQAQDSFADLHKQFSTPGHHSPAQTWEIVSNEGRSQRAQCVEGGDTAWAIYGPIEMIQFRLARLGCKRDKTFKATKTVAERWHRLST